MREYSGPTLGGGEATVQCPDWCVSDHAYWDEHVDDMFHQSALAEAVPPLDRDVRQRKLRHAQLGARLTVHSTLPEPAAAVLQLLLGERHEDVVELDATGARQLLAEVDRYRDELAGLVELLTTIDAGRRRAPKGTV